MSLYRWDTISSALWHLHGDLLEETIFATACEGDDPRIPRARMCRPWALLAALSALADPAEEHSTPCIVDIDIDYFTGEGVDSAYCQIFSDDFIRCVGLQLQRGITNGRFAVVTVALSPETTGSWSLAERTLALLLEKFSTFDSFRAAAP